MACAICHANEDKGGMCTSGDGFGDAKYVGIKRPEFAFYCWDCVKKYPEKIPNLDKQIDKAFKEHGFCGFLEAWIGRCRNELGACPKHSNQKCWKCGQPAVKNCAETFSLVCGVPECAEHPHEHPLPDWMKKPDEVVQESTRAVEL